MMSNTAIPISAQGVGDRFRPTEEELISYFLKQKNLGNDHLVSRIPEINISDYDPWDLPRYSTTSNESQWYFFWPRYLNCGRPKRTTNSGYWKGSGKERGIKSELTGQKIGAMKIFVFHTGRHPNGDSTRWIMHEYSASSVPANQMSFVLCKIMKKPDKKANMPTYDEGEASGTSGNTVTEVTFPEEADSEQLPYQEMFRSCNEWDYSL